MINIPTRLNPSQNINSLLRPSHLRQPPRTPRQQRQQRQQNHSRDELNAPCRTERSAALGRADEGAAIADEVHEQDTDFDRELLDHDDASALVFFGNLGQVDRDLGGGDADADSVDEAAGDELADAVGAYLEGGADEPETGALGTVRLCGMAVMGEVSVRKRWNPYVPICLR